MASTAQPQESEEAPQPASPPAAPPGLSLLALLEGGVDVSRCLLTFLHPREQRRLFNTCTRLADVKKHLLFWPLTIKRSKMFYTYPSFRAELEALMSDPGLQLQLTFRRHMLHCDHKAGAPNTGDESCLRNVHTVNWMDMDHLSSVSNFANVNTLNLWRCPYVTDVRPLSGVHCVNINGCRGIRNLDGLGKVQLLTISTANTSLT
jgi:hypothetical protein